MRKILTKARFAHSSFVVADLKVASDVLTSIFGFRVAFGPVDVSREMQLITGQPCENRWLSQLESPDGGLTVELVQGLPPENCGAVPHLAFHVDDLAVALAEIVTAGATVTGEVVTFSEGRAAYVQVPGGLFIELEELF